MEEFEKLINYCVNEFERLPICDTCLMNECHKGCRRDCYYCLSYIHRRTTVDEHYPCKKITYNYILKHGHRYASEIAWAVWDSRDRFKEKSRISIASVGCGPSTELYGSIRALPAVPLDYVGFDMSDKWESLQSFNCSNVTGSSRSVTYLNRDFIEYMRETSNSFDILILSYFFSDYVKYRPGDCATFIDDLIDLITSGHFTTVIVNDIPLFYATGTAFSCMEKIARAIKENARFHFELRRRHFAIPNEFQVEYGTKHDDRLAFPVNQKNVEPYDPFGTCGSIQLIINTYPKTYDSISF